jgi:hypothetical protein
MGTQLYYKVCCSWRKTIFLGSRVDCHSKRTSNFNRVLPFRVPQSIPSYLCPWRTYFFQFYCLVFLEAKSTVFECYDMGTQLLQSMSWRKTIFLGSRVDCHSKNALLISTEFSLFVCFQSIPSYLCRWITYFFLIIRLS